MSTKGTIPSTWRFSSTFLSYNPLLFGPLPSMMTLGLDGGYLLGTAIGLGRSLPGAPTHGQLALFLGHRTTPMRMSRRQRPVDAALINGSLRVAVPLGPLFCLRAAILTDIVQALDPGGTILTQWNTTLSNQPCAPYGSRTGRYGYGLSVPWVGCVDQYAGPSATRSPILGGGFTIDVSGMQLQGTVPVQLQELRTATTIYVRAPIIALSFGD